MQQESGRQLLVRIFTKGEVEDPNELEMVRFQDMARSGMARLCRSDMRIWIHNLQIEENTTLGVLNLNRNLLRSALYLPDTTSFGLWPLSVIDLVEDQRGRGVVYVADIFRKRNTDFAFDTCSLLQSLAHGILTRDHEQL